jgi:taurine dioxygenase
MDRQDVSSSGYRVEPLAAHLSWGTQVFDLEPAHLTDPKIRQDLRNLWIRQGVLVFRELQGEETLITLSNIFGPLWLHPTQENRAKDRPELIEVRASREDAWLTRIDGEVRSMYLPWHSDLFYVDKINHGGILMPVKLPHRLGHTGFIDKISAYESLPAHLKARIEGLHVVYRFDLDTSHQKFGRKHKAEVVQYSRVARAVKESIERDDYPDVLHPMVYEQPETGRKVLNVSPWFAIGIYGMRSAEGDALLEEVAQHLTREDNAYYHHWRSDDMVLWDNWRMLHSAVGAPPEEERHLRRTTIGGDYALGKVDPSFAGSREPRKHIQV